MSKDNGVRGHGYGLCSLNLHRLQLGDGSIGTGGQHIVIEQHVLALQVPIFGCEVVFLPCEPRCFPELRNGPSVLLCTVGMRDLLGALAGHIDMVCVVATEVDQE